MIEHTKEPWFYRRHIAGPPPRDVEMRSALQDAWYLGGPNGTSDFLADVFLKGDSNSEANIRRIVACVNACAGVPTAELESGKVKLIVDLAYAEQRVKETIRNKP